MFLTHNGNLAFVCSFHPQSDNPVIMNILSNGITLFNIYS